MTNQKSIQTRHGGNLDKGRIGEELAASYLREQGYQILFRNFHSRFGELDIVAKKSSTLTFVEVKTRTQDSYGSPGEAVDARKRRHMAMAATFFMQRFGIHSLDQRFDVIEVLLNHIENV